MPSPSPVPDLFAAAGRGRLRSLRLRVHRIDECGRPSCGLSPPEEIEDCTTYHNERMARGENRLHKIRVECEPRLIMHYPLHTSLFPSHRTSNSIDSVGSRWLLVCLTVLGLLASSALSQDSDEGHGPPTLAIGSAAPDFCLPGIDGQTHCLKEYSGAKVLMIAFICNHCPTAQLYETRIKKIADDYKDRDVAVVAIEPNNPNAVRLDEMGYTDVGDSPEEMKIR